MSFNGACKYFQIDHLVVAGGVKIQQGRFLVIAAGMIKTVGLCIRFPGRCFHINSLAVHFKNSQFSQLKKMPADPRSLKVFANGDPVKVKPSLCERNGTEAGITNNDILYFRKKKMITAGWTLGQSFFCKLPCNSRFLGTKKFTRHGQMKNIFRIRVMNGFAKGNIQGLPMH